MGVKSGTILLFEMQIFSTTFLLYAVILCCTLFLDNSSGFLWFFGLSSIFFIILERARFTIVSSSRSASYHRQTSSLLPWSSSLNVEEDLICR